MTLTKIVTGMEKGPEAINNNFTQLSTFADSQTFKDTGWIKTGVTYLNGTKADPDFPVAYRTIGSDAGPKFTLLRGYINNLTAKNNTTTAVCGLPDLGLGAYLLGTYVSLYEKDFVLGIKNNQLTVNNQSGTDVTAAGFTFFMLSV